jgi:hypothetical protein
LASVYPSIRALHLAQKPEVKRPDPFNECIPGFWQDL